MFFFTWLFCCLYFCIMSLVLQMCKTELEYQNFHLLSASTSLIKSSNSDGDGFCPSLLMTTPISSVVMKPLPSWSKSSKASRKSGCDWKNTQNESNKTFFVEQISQEVLSKESKFKLLFCDRNDCKSNFAVCAYIV